MTGGFGDDPFGGDHFDHLGAEHLGADHFGGEEHFGTEDHLGLADDAMGADHDAGFHAEYVEHHDDGGHDAAYGESGHEDPQPAEEPPGDHPADLSTAHSADAEPSQLDGTDTLPHAVDTSPFPPHLEVDVTPADGQDWVHVDHLGEPEPAYLAGTESPEALLAGLHEAEGADPADSDDPAIRSLALFWAH